MAQPRSRQKFDDQSNVNPIFHWINKLREDWSQPKPTWVGGDIGLREPGYDKYPEGSLTGKKKKKKKNK